MFELGQQVVCIDDKPREVLPPNTPFPVKGKIYTIRGMYFGEGGCILGLLLKEIKTGFKTKKGQEKGYAADRFEPLRSDPEVLEYISEKEHVNY